MARKKISTGSYDFNKWLYGGYERDSLNMIVGPPASGKTNFCILAACSSAKKGGKILFIDTEGGFSIERVKQIVGKNPEDYEKILERILILSPSDFSEQKKSFERMLKEVKKGINFIIIDGMAMHYRIELSNASSEQDAKKVNREMASQVKILFDIVRKNKIPVLMTNQVYKEFMSWEDLKKGKVPNTNIVGGDILQYWSKCIIELKNEGNKRKAILLKHRHLPKKEISFEIKDKGIFKKGWI